MLPYTELFGEQRPVVGATNQLRLRRLSVAVVGVGGIGSAVIQPLALAGVGRLLLIDAQKLEPSNFNRIVPMTAKDVGKPKAEFWADKLNERRHLRVVPIVATVQSANGTAALTQADVICVCANTTEGRLAAARVAVKRGVRCVSAGVSDARVSLAGQVLEWTGTRSDLACEGCFLVGSVGARRRASGSPGVVLPTVAGAVGAIAAHVIVARFLRNAPTVPMSNLHVVDMATLTMESLCVYRRADCAVCGGHVR